MQKDNVAVIHPSLSVNGGAEGVCIEIINTLLSLGARVTLFVAEPIYSAQTILISRLNPKTEDVRIISALPRGLPLMGKNKPPVLIAYAYLLRWLRNRDLTMFNYVLSTYGECDVVEGHRQACYIHFPVLPIYSTDAARLGGRLSSLPLLQRFYTQTARAISGFDRISPNALIMTNSYWTKEQIRRLSGYHTARVVYPNIAAFPIPPGESKAPVKNRPRCIVLGRFEVYKGHDLIVKALDHAAKDLRLTATCEFIGRGTDGDVARLYSLRTNNVEIEVLKDASSTTIGTAISRAHFAASAFRFEHFGRATAELMASGLPVFVHNDGGQTEIVNSNILTFGTLEDLSDRFKAVMSENISLKELAAYAYDRGRIFAGHDFKRAFTSSITEWRSNF